MVYSWSEALDFGGGGVAGGGVEGEAHALHEGQKVGGGAVLTGGEDVGVLGCDVGTANAPLFGAKAIENGAGGEGVGGDVAELVVGKDAADLDNALPEGVAVGATVVRSLPKVAQLEPEEGFDIATIEKGMAVRAVPEEVLKQEAQKAKAEARLNRKSRF